MTDPPSDPNRLDEPRTEDVAQEERSSGMAYGALAVIVLLIISGFIYYNHSESTQTASNSAPSVTRSAPTTTGGAGPTTNPPAAPR